MDLANVDAAKLCFVIESMAHLTRLAAENDTSNGDPKRALSWIGETMDVLALLAGELSGRIEALERQIPKAAG